MKKKVCFSAHPKSITISILELLQPEGGRMVMHKREYYNLDVIISVGYRVNTKRGTQLQSRKVSVSVPYKE